MMEFTCINLADAFILRDLQMRNTTSNSSLGGSYIRNAKFQTWSSEYLFSSVMNMFTNVSHYISSEM